jgi:protein involved in polysaccharide export with SLBB domain
MALHGLEIPQSIKSRLMEDLKKGEVDEPVPETNATVDNSIDPDSYFIGAGDVFSVSVIEMPSVRYSALVNQKGDVHIPALGVIPLGKVSLREAQEAIGGFVKTKIPGPHRVYVCLQEAKSATITVTGSVANPGTYVLKGTQRILDAIRKANDGKLPPLKQMNYRGVRLRNSDSTRYLDLYRFLFMQDLEQNPYVYPGDMVLLEPANRRVNVYGAVNGPVAGQVPIGRADDAASLFSMLQLDGSADSSRIVIQTEDGNGGRKTSEYSWRQLSGVKLHDRDVVVISPKDDYPRIHTVDIGGEVLRPGTYPIVWGKTRAGEIISTAGGPTDDADVNRAFIVRRKAAPKSQVIETISSSGIAAQAYATVVRPEIAGAFYRMHSTKDYIFLPLGRGRENPVLEPQDRIVFPRFQEDVFVSGNAREPGTYRYEEGKGYRYYVDRAGGFN